jgi:hypothetical protein
MPNKESYVDNNGKVLFIYLKQFYSQVCLLWTQMVQHTSTCQDSRSPSLYNITPRVPSHRCIRYNNNNKTGQLKSVRYKYWIHKLCQL